MSRDEWHKIVRELLERGYLTKSEGMYPTLKLADISQGVLEGSKKVMLTKNKKRSAESAGIHGAKLPYETGLYEELKNIRRELAAGENLAAYIVLSDATLVEMATYLPQNLDEISRISGFGEVKLEKYGANCLDAIRSYCRKHQLISRIDLKAAKKHRNGMDIRHERETETKQQSLVLFHQGNSIEQIAALRNLSPTTIEGHLAFYVQQGKLSVDELVHPDRIPVIRDAIEQVGGKILTPIKNFLGDDFMYSEIKYVRADMEKAERLREKAEC